MTSKRYGQVYYWSSYPYNSYEQRMLELLSIKVHVYGKEEKLTVAGDGGRIEGILYFSLSCSSDGRKNT